MHKTGINSKDQFTVAGGSNVALLATAGGKLL